MTKAEYRRVRAELIAVSSRVYGRGGLSAWDAISTAQELIKQCEDRLSSHKFDLVAEAKRDADMEGAE
jgi:hypothetical protein